VVLTDEGGIAARGGPPAPPVVSDDDVRVGERSLLGSTSTPRRCPPNAVAAFTAERGSQTLELALLLPVLAMLLAMVLQGGLAASELVLAQAVARDAARVAAVDDDAAARAAAQAVAGTRRVDVRIQPATAGRRGGELVTVTISLRSAAFHRLGIELWLPAEATMRVEDRADGP
jgi:Flp pilus assembly protein TadG